MSRHFFQKPYTELYSIVDRSNPVLIKVSISGISYLPGGVPTLSAFDGKIYRGQTSIFLIYEIEDRLFRSDLSKNWL
jgi:hypothetical protein